MKKTMMTLALTALAALAAAQGNFTLKLGLALPQGKFGEGDDNGAWALMDDDKEGGAGLGFNFGGTYKFKMDGVEGLSIVAGFDLFYNTLNSDTKEFVEEIEDIRDTAYSDYSVSWPHYINLPITLGANYTVPLSRSVALYGEAALGLNLRFITPYEEEVTYKSNSYNYQYYGFKESEYEQNYNVATTFAFRLAAGLTFNERYSLEVGYYALGAAKVKSDDSAKVRFVDGTSDSYDDKFKGRKVNPTQLTLRLGISF
ncbi:MAG: outer membrane beta-barrel protein [Bacteroidales bacterium]|nr:outer membrane beta-barrel protein [Bacteroidales bacterium]